LSWGGTMAKILVTGANGFIGSHLVRELLRQGHEVRGLVRHTSDLSSLEGVPISLFIGDVRDPATLVAPMRDVEYVYHLAAVLLTTSRAAFMQTNAEGTRNVLDAAAALAPGTLKRVLITSSQAAVGPNPTPAPVDESYAPRPISWSGESKKEVEAIARSYTGRLPITIVRPSPVYGEREQDISQTFTVIAQHVHPKLGLRPTLAVMVYVEDLVQGIIAAAQSDISVGKTYFLNHPQTLSTTDVVQTIAAAMGKPGGLLLPVPLLFLRIGAPLAEYMAQFTRQRPSTTRDKVRELAQQYWVADPACAKNELGWEAQHDLLNGMRPTTQRFFEQEQQAREMPLESTGSRWMKYLTVAILLGALIEISAATGKWYSFDPGWFVLVIVFGAFGFALGSLAMLLRTRSSLIQFVIGTLLAGAAELANVLIPSSFVRWVFAPGWPFGIMDPIVRSLVLGLAGGIFILIVNAIMLALYKRRLRLG
ncbi:MAG TPA: NAD-dependent epimerase/dehydratase family protein, partial [Anaerolineae bacterium]